MAHPRTARSSRRIAVATFGCLASIGLHVLLLAPTLFGGGGHPPVPPAPLRLASQDDGSEDGAMTLVLLSDTPITANNTPREPFTLPILSPASLKRVRYIPNNLPVLAVPDDEAHDSNVATEGSDQGQLFGRYVGQITARIERAWIRPRTQIDAPAFSCRVRIAQDHAGAVQEVEIIHCNGDLQWQLSLVHAIQSSSPLPAPPDPDVFASRLVLDLHSTLYSAAGTDTEGFEPARNLAASTQLSP